MANEDPFGIESLMKTWTQSVNEVMEKTNWAKFQTPFRSEPEEPAQTEKKKEASDKKNPMEEMADAMKFWQTMVKAMSSQESVKSAFKGAGAMPDMTAAFTQAIMSSLSELQKKMGQSAARMGESVDSQRFDHLDETLFNVWTQIYEKEFQKFFHIPQVGLSREYMERFNDMMDKFNRLQNKQAEFSRLMYVPFQRSMGVMQEKIANLAESGDLPEDSNDYYRMWVKILEGHFMTLFQTPEYLTALGETIQALSQFTQAKDTVMEDLMQAFPVAQQSDMDDMAKELYELKRRVRDLEREIRR